MVRGRQEAEAGYDVGRACRAVARYVRSGVRSAGSVRAYLTRRGIPPQAMGEVLDACRARGLVDDGAGVRLWAEHWARRGYAWSCIREKLRAKEFDEHAIMDAAGMYGTPSRDDASARRVVAAYLQRRSRLQTGQRSAQPRPSQAGLARTLASRGFDADVIDRFRREADGPSD